MKAWKATRTCNSLSKNKLAAWKLVQKKIVRLPALRPIPLGLPRSTAPSGPVFPCPTQRRQNAEGANLNPEWKIFFSFSCQFALWTWAASAHGTLLGRTFAHASLMWRTRALMTGEKKRGMSHRHPISSQLHDTVVACHFLPLSLSVTIYHSSLWALGQWTFDYPSAPCQGGHISLSNTTLK